MEVSSSPDNSISLVNVQVKNKQKRSKSKETKTGSRTPSPQRQNKKVALKNKIKSNMVVKKATGEKPKSNQNLKRINGFNELNSDEKQAAIPGF